MQKCRPPDLRPGTNHEHRSLPRANRNVIVENRPGASGMIGAELVSKAPPDGHTLLSTTSSYPGTVAVRAKVPFDPAKSFVPVAMIERAPIVLAVHPAMPAKTVKEFIAREKATAQLFVVGHRRQQSHRDGAFFPGRGHQDDAHPVQRHRSGRGRALSGEVDAIIASSPAVMTQVKAGKARAIAVTSLKPTPPVPGLPAIAESGVPVFTYENWWGLFAPAGTPRTS
jgi:tripartite-type tricarboxylate transporter receptor subunit TctC